MKCVEWIREDKKIQVFGDEKKERRQSASQMYKWDVELHISHIFYFSNKSLVVNIPLIV